MSMVSNRAFSLVELSIVLVILGLLTGGILAGKSLIRASELRGVSTEYQRYITAVSAFRDKYFGIPGDISNATAIWGKDNTNCSGNTGTAATPGTCNGNADGLLSGTNGAGGTGEGYQFWKQLALAGLIEGSFSGTAGAGGSLESVIGTNVPGSKLAGGGWTASYLGNYAGNGTVYAMDYGNYFIFGKALAASSTYDRIMTSEELWNIDTKIDDGLPAYGKLIARFWSSSCATGGASSSDLANSVYNLSSTGINCSANFRQLF